jgi:hypothetical protein
VEKSDKLVWQIMADRVTGPESEVFGVFWHEEAAPLQSEGRIIMAAGLAEGAHQRLQAPRGAPAQGRASAEAVEICNQFAIS